MKKGTDMMSMGKLREHWILGKHEEKKDVRLSKAKSMGSKQVKQETR